MNLYIVEDEMFHLEDLQITVEELGHQCVGHSDDPFEALEQIRQSKAQSVIIDIHLNGRQSGIDLARSIKNQFHLPVIFTSSDQSDQIMSDAADIDPIAYLTKPVNPGDLKGALILAQKKIDALSNSAPVLDTDFYIKHVNKLVKVTTEEILYVYSDTKNYCSLVTSDGKKLTFRHSIQGFYKLLDPELFVQTHRAYLINLNKIESFHEHDQTIEIQGKQIPVGRTFRSRLLKKMKII